jgi:putative ABC transport system permease protein
VIGITANYLSMNNLSEFSGGDDLTEDDIDTRARVAVIGSAIAEKLYGDSSPLGDSIKIGGISYEVVGVMAEQGQGFATNPDENVYIPITTAQSRLYPDRTRRGDHAVTTIVAQAIAEDATDTAVVQITEVLREQHEITYTADDDFTLISQTDLLETFDVITGTLTAFLGAIAGISLVVGGIGIMNIMLVSVTERTREIGIRKAVGALRRDILVQFLLESMLLSLVGGVLGILLGWVIAQIGGSYIDLTPIMDISTVLLAAGFAATVGLVFGIYPAWRAASLRPIEALRYE